MYMLTEREKGNLKVLRDFLDNNRDLINLDMGTYCRASLPVGYRYGDPKDSADYEDCEVELRDFVKEGLLEKGVGCGASMCMLGWAATVFSDQVEVDGEGYVRESWSDVGVKLFGTHDSFFEPTGRWLFSSDWESMGEGEFNTIEHALYRIDRVLAAESEDEYKDVNEEFSVYKAL